MAKLTDLPTELHIHILSFITEFQHQVLAFKALPIWRSILLLPEFRKTRYTPTIFEYRGSPYRHPMLKENRPVLHKFLDANIYAPRLLARDDRPNKIFLGSPTPLTIIGATNEASLLYKEPDIDITDSEFLNEYALETAYGSLDRIKRNVQVHAYIHTPVERDLRVNRKVISIVRRFALPDEMTIRELFERAMEVAVPTFKEEAPKHWGQEVVDRAYVAGLIYSIWISDEKYIAEPRDRDINLAVWVRPIEAEPEPDPEVKNQTSPTEHTRSSSDPLWNFDRRRLFR